MQVGIGTSGSFNNTYNFVNKNKKQSINLQTMHRYGMAGLVELYNRTPKKTENTATAWSYTVTDYRNGRYQLTFYNDHRNKGALIVALLHYGHFTRHGGYARPRDFINPSLKPVFDKLSGEAWKEVTSV